VPPGWRLVSALDETQDSSVFTAPDYDALVDAPTWLGAFDLHRFVVEGKPHYLVLEVPGRLPPFPSDSIAAAVARAASIIEAQSAIFGGLPYEKYVIFRTPGPGADAIEHATSSVTVNSNVLGSALDSHEFFHVWNVKRIRPVEMWPYDYSQPNVTTSLWFSEGVTSYYSDLTRYRAGLKSDTVLLDDLANAINASRVDSSGSWNWNNDSRRHVSPADASVATWLGRSHWAYWQYYSQGELLGALLDLSILHDTDGARGLDDVMRRLYHEFYERNRGFKPDDLIRAVSNVAGRDCGDFFSRFVTGVEVPPFDTVFGYAGVRLRARYAGVIEAPQEVVEQGRRILRVTPGGPAAAAGLRPRDIIVTVDGQPVNRFIPWCCAAVSGDGVQVTLGILRDSSRMDVVVVLRRGPAVSPGLEFDPAPSAQQLKIRSAWLARTPRR
jgi:predicted metalloprotease with PDZ domain